MAPSPSRPRIRYVTLDRRQRPVSVKDLGAMLEIDLMIGDRSGFERRLQRALDAAYRQGLGLH